MSPSEDKIKEVNNVRVNAKALIKYCHDTKWKEHSDYKYDLALITNDINYLNKPVIWYKSKKTTPLSSFRHSDFEKANSLTIKDIVSFFPNNDIIYDGEKTKGSEGDELIYYSSIFKNQKTNGNYDQIIANGTVIKDLLDVYTSFNEGLNLETFQSSDVFNCKLCFYFGNRPYAGLEVKKGKKLVRILLKKEVDLNVDLNKVRHGSSIKITKNNAGSYNFLLTLKLQEEAEIKDTTINIELNDNQFETETESGGSVKVKKVVLGRERILVKKGRTFFLRYKGKDITLTEARKLEKKKTKVAPKKTF